MPRNDAPASPEQKPAPKEAAAGPDFDSATLAEWAANAEDAIAKRLKGLRPQTGPLADNALFLWGISRLARRQPQSNERGQFLSEPFIRELVSSTPMRSRKVAEGLAWFFMLKSEDLPAWKISRSKKFRHFIFPISLHVAYITFLICSSNGKFFQIFYPSNLLILTHWLILPWNFIHLFSGALCFILMAYWIGKANEWRFVNDSLSMAYWFSSSCILAQMGPLKALRQPAISEVGCFVTLLCLFLSITVSIAGAVATGFASFAVYQSQSLWPKAMWPFIALIVLLFVVFDALLRKVRSSSTPEKRMASLIKIVDEWRGRPKSANKPRASPKPKSKPPKNSPSNNDTRRRSRKLQGGPLRNSSARGRRRPGL